MIEIKNGLLFLPGFVLIMLIAVVLKPVHIQGLKQSVAAMRQEARMLKLQTEEKVLLKEMAALTTYLSNTRIVLSCMDERNQDPMNTKNSVAASRTDRLSSSFVQTSNITGEIPFIRQENCAAQGSILNDEMDDKCLREALNNGEKGINGCGAQGILDEGHSEMVERLPLARWQEEGTIIKDGRFSRPSKLNRTAYVRVRSMPERKKEDWSMWVDRCLDSFALSEEAVSDRLDDQFCTEKGNDVPEQQLQNACIVEHVECDRVNLEAVDMDAGQLSKTSSSFDVPEAESQVEYVSAEEEAEDLGVLFQARYLGFLFVSITVVDPG